MNLEIMFVDNVCLFDCIPVCPFSINYCLKQMSTAKYISVHSPSFKTNAIRFHTNKRKDKQKEEHNEMWPVLGHRDVLND